jgi:transposase-like protein
LTDQEFPAILHSMETPKTLQQAIIYFSDAKNCNDFMVAMRWPDGQVQCPRCGSENVTYLETARVWKCYSKHPKAKFSLKVGTIFEDSPLGLDKWFTAMWLIANCKNGISSYELGRHLGITQKAAWHVNHRIRLAMQNGSLAKLSGHIEVDETFIGGLARNRHSNKRKHEGTGGAGKVAVMGLLERRGEVRTHVLTNTQATTLQPHVRRNVEAGSNLYTDKYPGYKHLDDDFIHGVINHAVEYVRGNVHTNGIENFWSLLKRTLKGTYVSVEPFHLFRYLDEQAYRFNKRKMTDFQRFIGVVEMVTGKRLEYKQLVGRPAC